MGSDRSNSSDCKECQEQLGDVSEGVLDFSSVQVHLANCSDCQAIYQRYLALNACLRSDRDRDPSPGFDEAFFARLAAERESPFKVWLERWLRPGRLVPLAASVVAAVVAVSVIHYRGQRLDEEQRFIAANQDLLANLDVLDSSNSAVLAAMQKMQGIPITGDDFEVIAKLDQLAKAD